MEPQHRTEFTLMYRIFQLMRTGCLLLKSIGECWLFFGLLGTCLAKQLPFVALRGHIAASSQHFQIPFKIDDSVPSMKRGISPPSNHLVFL